MSEKLPDKFTPPGLEYCRVGYTMAGLIWMLEEILHLPRAYAYTVAVKCNQRLACMILMAFVCLRLVFES